MDFQVKGKKVTLFLREKGYRFTGVVLDESEEFLKIESAKTGYPRFFNKHEIESLEVLDG